MESLKKLFLLLLTIIMITSSPIAWADAPAIKVFINGQEVNFDVPPDLKNGITLVPVRGVFEALGAEVEWDAETRTVFVTGPNTVLAMQIGVKHASLNGQNVELLRGPEIKSGRTLVPLRMVAEALGAEVKWDGEKRIITIATNPPKFSDTGAPIDNIVLPDNIFGS